MGCLLDTYRSKGTHHQSSHNHDKPVCEHVRAIDTAYFYRDWYLYPNAVPPIDICDGRHLRKTPKDVVRSDIV